MTCRSFSHQRNAGMKLLLPCRMPAWLAEVCDGSSAVHLSSRICVAADPLRDERHASGPDLVRRGWDARGRRSG